MDHKPSFSQKQYLAADTALTYRSTAGEGSADGKEVEAYTEELLDRGYVVLPSLVSQRELDLFRTAATPLLSSTGRNNFEGDKTQRIYGVPGKFFEADPMIEHPLILGILDQILRPNYLLSQGQAINLLPGEVAQPIHYDDAFYHWPRPRPPLGAATIWAIDDFTSENGATVVFPNSHHLGTENPDKDAELIKATMPAGSCILFLGTTWHGGGANRSNEDRLAFTAQYCEPWCRTQENYFLAVDKEMVKPRSEAMKRLLGYSIHPPFIGMVNGMHPKRCLEDT